MFDEFKPRMDEVKPNEVANRTVTNTTREVDPPQWIDSIVHPKSLVTVIQRLLVGPNQPERKISLDFEDYGYEVIEDPQAFQEALEAYPPAFRNDIKVLINYTINNFLVKPLFVDSLPHTGKTLAENKFLINRRKWRKMQQPDVINDMERNRIKIGKSISPIVTAFLIIDEFSELGYDATPAQRKELDDLISFLKPMVQAIMEVKDTMKEVELSPEEFMDRMKITPEELRDPKYESYWNPQINKYVVAEEASSTFNEWSPEQKKQFVKDLTGYCIRLVNGFGFSTVHLVPKKLTLV